MTMSRELTGCDARQFSDQMICGRCGLQWDTNDPDPPACIPRGKPIMEPTKPETRTVYIVHPGVINARDGDTHFISGRELIELYRLRDHMQRNDTVLISDGNGRPKGVGRNERAVHLYPMSSGNYEIPGLNDPLAEARKILGDDDEK